MPLDHYVSQVYLRNFYSPALGHHRMYAMRKGDMKCFECDSKSVCRIEDGSTNAFLRDNRVIEEFLKTIEPNYNNALDKLRREKIDPECIYTIAGFVAYVSTCSPAAMRIFSKPIKALAETLTVTQEQHGRLPPLPNELSGTSFADLLRTGDLEIEVNPKYPQAIGIRTIMQNIIGFGSFKWDILLNPFERSPFFTSDFPVAIERTEDPRLLNRIAPLAPNLAIRIRPDLTSDRKRIDFTFPTFGYHLRSINHNELLEINRLIVRCAEEAVFYRDDLPWVRQFIAKQRAYRVEAVIRKLPSKDGSLLISTQRVVPYNHKS
jgi:Protein of unknown function (DUF4238)